MTDELMLYFEKRRIRNDEIRFKQAQIIFAEWCQFKAPKSQVILKIVHNDSVHFIKKRSDGLLTIEGHTSVNAIQHNLNLPSYFFFVDEDFVSEMFVIEGKTYRKTGV